MYDQSLSSQKYLKSHSFVICTTVILLYLIFQFDHCVTATSHQPGYWKAKQREGPQGRRNQGAWSPPPHFRIYFNPFPISGRGQIMATKFLLTLQIFRSSYGPVSEEASPARQPRHPSFSREKQSTRISSTTILTESYYCTLMRSLKILSK